MAQLGHKKQASARLMRLMSDACFKTPTQSGGQQAHGVSEEDKLKFQKKVRPILRKKVMTEYLNALFY